MTAVACVTPAAQTPWAYSNLLSVTVSRLVGCQYNLFSYDAPALTSASAGNAPRSGQASLTLAGLNFAQFNSCPTVTVGGSLCLTQSWSTLTAVICQVMPGSQLASMVGVNLLVEGGPSNLFSYDAPILTFMPRNAMSVVLRTASLSLMGLNFGLVDLSVSVALGSTMCSSVSWRSDTSVVCAAPIGSGESLSAVVTSQSLHTVVSFFTFDAPRPSALAPVNAPTTGGSLLSLWGSSFGSEDLSPTVAIQQTACATTSWTSASQLLCRAVPSSDSVASVTLRVSTLSGTALIFMTYDSVALTAILPGNAPTSGQTSLTLAGVNFGATSLSVTARIGQTVCSEAVYIASTSMVCAVPAGTGRLQSVVITTADVLASTRTALFTFDAPSATHLRSANAGTSGWASLTLVGLNFALQNFSPTVTLGMSVCISSSWVTTTTLVCSSAAGTGLGLGTLLGISSLLGTSAVQFSYDAPGITSVRAANGATSGSSSLTLRGVGFGTVNYSPFLSATPSFVQCSTSSWVSPTVIRCLLQASYGSELSLGLVIGTLLGSAPLVFSYDAPVVTGVSYFASSALLGFSTISGVNFGSANPTPTVRIGNTLCTSTSWLSGSSIYCTTPAGAGVNQAVSISLGIASGVVNNAFTFTGPILSQMNPPNAVLSGGSRVRSYSASSNPVCANGLPYRHDEPPFPIHAFFVLCVTDRSVVI